MDPKQTTFRTLMFPWLAHGHIFPFLELAKTLSKSNFQIYFCSTAINLDSIKKTLNHDDSNVVPIELIELKLPSFQELPSHYHTTKNIPHHLMPTLMKAFQESTSNFCKIITNLKPDLLIYDSFQPCAAKMASSLGIPCVHFATSGSTTFSFCHHWYTHKSYDSFPYKGMYLREYEKRNLVVHGGSIKVEHIGEGFAFGVFELSCEIVLMKSCRGIEGKIVALGPLLVKNQGNVDLETIHWSSQKGELSTLYISFGSENYLSKKQIQEIAKGLELSNVNFIWVDRSPKSVYFGVPVVAMPLKLDQPVNSRLVGEGGFGVEVIRDENGEFDGKGVAKAINMLFLGESGEGIRRRVKELSEKMRMEEQEGAFGVVEELTRICIKKGGKRGDSD
ncbi:UDP-glucuronosyl and UDP-glucosyl transferase [Handroanthus impetiginosus]|uniref:UDP-glucuronosyl and UDP-glucosyl transferase n=1 Tax=Handroanthus impetiginosus TaxID=429701 RepID=A0A2G9FXG5_9LAMI|nr:UDP-glucuronosyl and UDP-glucosyl transferase [Handroanthus impetiginosus]